MRRIKIKTYDIDKLQLSNRTRNALKRNGIFTREQLFSYTDSQLLNMRKVGMGILEEIRSMEDMNYANSNTLS